MIMSREPVSAERFHAGEMPVYGGSDGHGPFKDSALMARVVYEPAHANPAAAPHQQGRGRLSGTWVFCEEDGKREQRLVSDIRLFMDSTLEPGACIGLHAHADTEEIYYLLEGALTIEHADAAGRRIVRTLGRRIVRTLGPGDAHHIRPGEQHCIEAGGQGARFIVVAAGVPGSGHHR
jgi:quercetin dioxygenase-like cupin family protein